MKMERGSTRIAVGAPRRHPRVYCDWRQHDRGGAVSWVTVAAVFLERSGRALQRCWHEKQAVQLESLVCGHRPRRCVAAFWLCPFSRLSVEIIAATTAVAAGAILAMITDTMIPEAFERP